METELLPFQGSGSGSGKARLQREAAKPSSEVLTSTASCLHGTGPAGLHMDTMG